MSRSNSPCGIGMPPSAFMDALEEKIDLLKENVSSMNEQYTQLLRSHDSEDNADFFSELFAIPIYLLRDKLTELDAYFKSAPDDQMPLVLERYNLCVKAFEAFLDEQLKMFQMMKPGDFCGWVDETKRTCETDAAFSTVELMRLELQNRKKIIEAEKNSSLTLAALNEHANITWRCKEMFVQYASRFEGTEHDKRYLDYVNAEKKSCLNRLSQIDLSQIALEKVDADSIFSLCSKVRIDINNLEFYLKMSIQDAVKRIERNELYSTLSARFEACRARHVRSRDPGKERGYDCFIRIFAQLRDYFVALDAQSMLSANAENFNGRDIDAALAVFEATLDAFEGFLETDVRANTPAAPLPRSLMWNEAPPPPPLTDAQRAEYY